jgi:hypothetical protein
MERTTKTVYTVTETSNKVGLIKVYLLINEEIIIWGVREIN